MTVRILVGDVRLRLRDLADESVHCCVTSPPYFGLRAYLPDGHPEKAKEIGLEASPEAYVAEMVAVFREVRRVLRKDGTLWLNLGDSYASSTKGSGGTGKSGLMKDGRREEQRIITADRSNATAMFAPRRFEMGGAKPKDLLGMPWRVAFALQADGWWLRQALPWVKRNPMPESADDRPTSAVEYVFMLTKSARYFYDYAAAQRVASEQTNRRLAQDVEAQIGSARANGGAKTNGTMKAVRGKQAESAEAMDRGRAHKVDGFNGRWDEKERKRALARSGIKNNDSMDAALAVMPEKRAFRNSDLFFDSLSRPLGAITVDGEMVALDVPSRGFAEAHFATFPPALVEPLIRAGASERGVCPTCGAPWVRETKRERTRDGEPLVGSWMEAADPRRLGATGVGHWRDKSIVETLGWSPSCACGGDPVPATVLDCFGGAGTTALVADRLGRNAILIELNPDYAAMAERRIKGDAGLFAECAAASGIVTGGGDPAGAPGAPEARVEPGPAERGTPRMPTLLLALLLLASSASAHEPGEPWASWYESLTRPGGGSCCSLSDGRNTSVRVEGDHYEAWIDGRFPEGDGVGWVRVKPEAVLDRVANPTGSPVVFWRASMGVLCMVRATES